MNIYQPVAVEFMNKRGFAIFCLDCPSPGHLAPNILSSGSGRQGGARLSLRDQIKAARLIIHYRTTIYVDPTPTWTDKTRSLA